MESYHPSIGTHITELDTPCLLVDLDAFEHNIDLVADTYRDTQVKMRPHCKNIKSPAVEHLQIQAGGTVGGVCAAKVAEAEVMVQGGINDVFIPNQIVTRDKIERLCALAKRADVKVAIDNSQNLKDLSDIAQHHDVVIGVLIEVDTSMGRAGIRDVQQGVDLAKEAVRLPNIAFRGVMSHQTLPGKPDRETRFIEGRRYIQMCLDVRDAIEAAGIPVEVVSTGESWTYDVATTIPGITEVEGGTYALMSHDYDYMTDFQIAAKVLGTVISTPRPGIAVGDAGSRAIASLKGVLPKVEGMPDVTVDGLYEEHIVLRVGNGSQLEIGDKFLLISGHEDSLVNRWDQFIGVRNGVVETVWDIPGRGCFH